MDFEINTYGLGASAFQAVGLEICKLSSIGLDSAYPQWCPSPRGELNVSIPVPASSVRELTVDDLWNHGHPVPSYRVLASRSAVYQILLDGCDEPSFSSYLGAGFSDFFYLNNFVTGEHFLPRLDKFHLASNVQFFLQRAAVLHDTDNLLFTTNYDRVVGNLTSPWGTGDRAEVLIEGLRSKVTYFKEAINSFWSWTKIMAGSGHIAFDQQELKGSICKIACEWNPLLFVTSYVAKVVSQAQTLIDKFTKRVSRLVKLRLRFIAPEEQSAIFRAVIERRFFCIHGFHPPDLELPKRISSLLLGYVPGLLPI